MASSDLGFFLGELVSSSLSSVYIHATLFNIVPIILYIYISQQSSINGYISLELLLFLYSPVLAFLWELPLCLT
jgi:hypothetical protein